MAGQTSSANLPTTPGAYNTTFSGATDAFVAELAAAPGPMITSVSPAQGGVGASLRIYGSGFGDQQNGSTVTISEVAAQPTNWSNWEIDLTVPQITNSGPVEVLIGRTSFVTSTSSLNESHLYMTVTTSRASYIIAKK